CRRRRLAYAAVSRVAVMVTVSEDLKRFVVERTGAAARRVHVVYNGIGPARSVSEETKESLRAEVGIHHGDGGVAVGGNLYGVKGHRYLLEAVPRILEACPSTVFLIAGRGEQEATLREQAKALGIDPSVRFLGLREDVPALLATCDLFVLPSLSEGLSIAILEAMSSARPVVTTRVGGNPELVVDGETGVLVAPADPEQLASAVVRTLTKPAEARRLGENGLNRVKSRF